MESNVHKIELVYRKVETEIYIDDVEYSYDINREVNIGHLRNAFNTGIASVHRNDRDLEYWLLSVLERNTLTNDLFLDICRISMILSIMKERGSILIYTENVGIFLHLKSISKIKILSSISFYMRYMYQLIRPYIGIIKFLTKSLIFRILYVRKSRQVDLSDSTIIQTHDNLYDKGLPLSRDRYFSGLEQYLKRQGRSKLHMWMLNSSNNIWPSEKQLLTRNWIKRREKIEELSLTRNVLLLEDYLHMVDYVFPIVHFMKKRKLIENELTVSGTNFGELFKYYISIEHIEYSSLIYQFLKRIGETNYDNITFIQNWENMMYQKVLIYGANKYISNNVVIGSFHSSKPKNLLCLEYVDENDYTKSPRPTRINFHADTFLRYYLEKYTKYPGASGYAFKQEYLKSNVVLKEYNGDRDRLLVLFSGNIEDVKLMCKFVNFIDESKELVLRLHPMLPFKISRYIEHRNIHYDKHTSLAESVSRSSKVISTYSSVALECAVLGAQVGFIYNDKRLLINPFDNTGVENYKLISNRDKLNEFISDNSLVEPKRDFFNLDVDKMAAYL